MGIHQWHSHENHSYDNEFILKNLLIFKNKKEIFEKTKIYKTGQDYFLSSSSSEEKIKK